MKLETSHVSSSSLTVFHPWQDSAFTKGFVLLCGKSRECEFIMNVHATKKPESLYVEGVFVKAVLPQSEFCNVALL